MFFICFFLQFILDDDEDGGNDVLTVKRRDHDIDDPLDGEGETDQNDGTGVVTNTKFSSLIGDFFNIEPEHGGRAHFA